MILDNNFYNQSTTELAKKLLGCILVHKTVEGVTSGRIVETEAYLCDDEACHAYNGLTKRVAVLFGPAGHAYIYFVYGMYYCFNVSSGSAGVGEAVLIRALEPIAGVELMQKRRDCKPLHELCNGPAKLVMAMAINKNQNGLDLRRPPLYIEAARMTSPIVTTKRIGISKAQDLPLRFYLDKNAFVSRP